MGAFTINSEANPTLSSTELLFNFLSDFKNFELILPEDKVENFEYTNQSCSFNIKGITAMTIKMVEKKPYDLIIFETDGLAKFNFNLKVNFKNSHENFGQCQIDLIGEMNPFILKMVEKQLTQLVNTMSLKLSKLQLN